MHDKAIEIYTKTSLHDGTLTGQCTYSLGVAQAAKLPHEKNVWKLNKIHHGPSRTLAHTTRPLTITEAESRDSSGKPVGKSSGNRSGKPSGKLHRKAASKYLKESLQGTPPGSPSRLQSQDPVLEVVRCTIPGLAGPRSLLDLESPAGS